MRSFLYEIGDPVAEIYNNMEYTMLMKHYYLSMEKICVAIAQKF